MSHVTYRVRVPASTSNCGPGFDTLGLAFNLYNEVMLRPEANRGIRSPDSRFGERERAMAAEVAESFFARAGLAPFGFSFSIRGAVPVARGLGSSVTLRGGILAGLNAASGSPLDRQALADVVSRLEGHPDNAVAAIFGGFCVARTDPGSGCLADLIRFEVPEDLAFVVLSPDLEIETSASRRSLPAQIPFAEVVKSLNSLAFIVSVFATGRYEKLRGAVTDFIHQPYRLPAIPGVERAIEAGMDAGGYTGWLSGSGSSFLCVCPARDEERVASAMAGILEQQGVGCVVNRLRADNDGLQVRSDDTEAE